MNIVSRIQFPNTTDVSDLYIKCQEGASINFREGCREVSFVKGSSISLNTYFNSFYEKYYAKYTVLCSLYYLMKLKGDFQVSLYKEVYRGEARELIYRERFENCHLNAFVKIPLPSLNQNDNSGRIYLEIMCLSECGSLVDGLIATEQTKIREISLGIITCTFRKEIYIKRTVTTILQDELLKNKDFKIFVVDNGRTLKEGEFEDKRFKLIHNRNVGGSGGFTRGLIEALNENLYTHFLFMDDDIELDSETIYRLFSLYEYAENDFAVTGSMLDLYEKHLLFEAGGLNGKLSDCITNHPFSTVALKSNLDLRDANSLNSLLLEENIDYGAFWFFAFSKNLVEKIGLPMPFFIKVDDVEFGLRIKECHGEIVSFPTFAVWHEPFYSKAPVWDMYYFYRNHLITNSIYKSFGYLEAIKYITKRVILSLMIFDYNTVAMLVRAFEDYSKGPAFIENSDPETLHSDILKLSKSYKSQVIQQDLYLEKQLLQQTKSRVLSKLISLITLNGHLLPNFLISNSDALVWIGPNRSLYEQWHVALAKKRVKVAIEKNTNCYQNELDKLAGIRLLAKWFKVAIRNSVSWVLDKGGVEKAAKDLTSIKSWQRYLGLQETS